MRMGHATTSQLRPRETTCERSTLNQTVRPSSPIDRRPRTPSIRQTASRNHRPREAAVYSIRHPVSEMTAAMIQTTITTAT